MDQTKGVEKEEDCGRDLCIMGLAGNGKICRAFGIPSAMWEYSSQIDLEVTELEGVDYIYVGKNRTKY
jgi:hypothetical protein